MTNVTISDLKAIFNVASCRNGAVHLPPPRCYCRRVMAHTDKQETSPLREAAGPTDPNQVAARDRRAVRSEDLSEEEIAAVEASAMGPGFENLDAELGPAGVSVVEVGVDFGRALRVRSDAARGRPADKAFRDSLFDDS
jgi:hypothetical protein